MILDKSQYTIFLPTLVAKSSFRRLKSGINHEENVQQSRLKDYNLQYFERYLISSLNSDSDRLNPLLKVFLDVQIFPAVFEKAWNNLIKKI